MDKKEQVLRWVRNKIEKVINEDINSKIVNENSTFDIETYVNYLLDEFFNENEVEKLKKSLNTVSRYDLYFSESENSSEEQSSIQNSLGYETNDYQTFPVEDIIKNLESDSEEVRIKYLRVLELSVEDLINQNLLNKVIETLQKVLNKTGNEEEVNLVLKVFQKLLKCPKKPQLLCKSFSSITEVAANQIDKFNSKVEKINNTNENKSGLKSYRFKGSRNFQANPEILIKLMWLLLDSQQLIRIKGLRFNENKFREITFSFIHLLSSTTTNSENTKLSGLELVAVLDPTANWCRYWCHTAVGRTLLCSALRKYKHFFVYIIEDMLKYMKIRHPNRLPSVTKSISSQQPLKPFKKILNIDRPIAKFPNRDFICSAPEKNFKTNERIKDDEDWRINGIPRRIINEAVFLHSVSLVSCLIQYRSGRALFPVQTATKKRLLNVQDLSVSIIEHLESFENHSKMNYTSAYEAKVLEILNDLNKLKSNINSFRSSSERH